MTWSSAYPIIFYAMESCHRPLTNEHIFSILKMLIYPWTVSGKSLPSYQVYGENLLLTNALIDWLVYSYLVCHGLTKHLLYYFNLVIKRVNFRLPSRCLLQWEQLVNSHLLFRAPHGPPKLMSWLHCYEHLEGGLKFWCFYDKIKIRFTKCWPVGHCVIRKSKMKTCS